MKTILLTCGLSLVFVANVARSADVDPNTPISEIWGEAPADTGAAKPTERKKKPEKKKAEKKVAKKAPKPRREERTEASANPEPAPARSERSVASSPAAPPVEAAKEAPAAGTKPFGGLMPLIESPKKKPDSNRSSATESAPRGEETRSIASEGCRAPASIESAVSNKSQYTLFNPAPEGVLREFNTDRPDKTADPYTIDAGHLQVEADAVNFRTSRRTEIEPSTGEAVTVTAQRLVVSGMNLRYGLTRATDLEAEIEAYVTSTEDVGGTKTTEKGMGDMRLRYKWNLAGNDGGTGAMALMLIGKIPTNSLASENKRPEGGLAIPVGLRIGPSFELRSMIEVDYIRNLDDLGYHDETTASFGVTDELWRGGSVFVEYYNVFSDNRGAGWRSYFDTGVQVEVARDVKIDASVDIGMTAATPDWNPIVGLAARF